MSRRVILLEGGEGTGKSTIAKWLVESHGFKLVKLPTPGSDYERAIFNKEKYPISLKQKAVIAVSDMAMAMFANQKEERIVLDRGILSTCAYQDPTQASDAVYACDAMDMINAITDVVVLKVSPEVGLAREEGTNEVSSAGLNFHRAVNNRYEFIGDAMEYILKCRNAERLLGAKLPRSGLLAQQGDDYDLDLLDKLGKHPNMIEWEWLGLQSVCVIDTEKEPLNVVKNTISSTVGLPA